MYCIICLGTYSVSVKGKLIFRQGQASGYALAWALYPIFYADSAIVFCVQYVNENNDKNID